LHGWTWDELRSLPATEVTADIHCVTKWSKLDTRWKGVSFDTLLRASGLEPPEPFVMAVCDGGYTTNLSVADLRADGSLIAYEFDGAPLAAEHGGPVRLVIPHLYFWKSAKWVRGLRFMPTNQPGFWESHGYHLQGDPWKEQRYAGD
jgi:DMSO/TMAO reductase YedYZ molybdopterin-dependent catalytic subunit